MGMMTFFFWPLLFLLPVTLFWLAWMGMFTLASLTWIRMTWRLWIWPVAIMVVAMFVADALFHSAHHVVGWLVSIALWICLPIGLGIWFARRHPKPPSPWDNKL
jgi:hypothetical protein